MQTTIDNNLPPPARTATRPSVSYEAYVKDYARLAAWYVFVAAAGMAATAGAVIRLDGSLQVTMIAIGLGATLGGLAGFAAAAYAHSSYTRLMAMSVTTTYQEPQKVETVRPFVASRNAPRTVRAGRIALPASTWAALFATAASNGGRLTRDGAIKAGLPRDLYHANWQGTVGEFKRLGLVDEEGKLTDAAARLISPYPQDAEAQPFAPRTNERRTNGANGEG